MAVRFLYDNDARRGDLRRSGANLLTDEGLESAIHISLLTNRRADKGDPLPTGHSRGGWCLDHLDERGRVIGSKLWLLRGAKLPPSGVVAAARYAREALLWLVEDGVAAEVKTEARLVRAGLLGILVQVRRPDDPAERWRPFWIAVELATLTE